VSHEDRIRELLGQKPDVSAEEFDRGCLPAALYLFAVLLIGTGSRTLLLSNRKAPAARRIEHAAEALWS
jgi:hypothetical protein